MNAALLNLAIRSFGPKLIRNTLAWLAGFLAAYGVALETNSVYTFVGSVMVAVFVVLWSVIAKAKPSDELRDKVGDFAHAVVAMLMPAILGWLKAKGITLTGDETAEQLAMMTLLTTSSALNKPDAKAETLKVKPGPSGPLPLFLFACLCAGSLTACQSIKGAILSAQMQAALRASCVLFVAVFCSSCMAAKGEGWAFASLGTNAEGIDNTAAGLKVAKMNQTEAVKQGVEGLTRLATIKGAYSLGETFVKKTPDVIESFTK